MIKKVIQTAFFVWIVTILASCTSNNIQTYSEDTPVADIREYFNGSIKAWGFIQDWRGRVTRRFDIDMVGSWDGNTGILEEYFRFYDGEIQERTWTLNRLSDSEFTGQAHDVIGQARGKMSGNAIAMEYRLDVPYKDSTIRLTLDDRMWLMNDGVMINKTKMKKFVISLGTLTIFMQKETE